MRTVTIVTGALLVLAGLAAVVTGEAVVHGAWAMAAALGALGVAGLVATATAVSR